MVHKNSNAKFFCDFEIPRRKIILWFWILTSYLIWNCSFQPFDIDFLRHENSKLYFPFFEVFAFVWQLQVLKPIPNSLTQCIRSFSKNLEGWLNSALNDVLPEQLKAIKVICIFSLAFSLCYNDLLLCYFSSDYCCKIFGANIAKVHRIEPFGSSCSCSLAKFVASQPNVEWLK